MEIVRAVLFAGQMPPKNSVKCKHDEIKIQLAIATTMLK